MRLQRIAIYRLTRILAGILPVGLVVLIAIAAWDYWARARDARPESADQLGEFPDDLVVRTNGFKIRRTEGGKPLFQVVAKETLGYKDQKRRGKDVGVEIYPKKEGDPVRHIHSDECSYDEKSEEIFCTRNVTIQLDENTVSRTEEVTYSSSTRLISSDVRTHIEQPGQMTGDAGHLKYFMDTGLLALTEDVRIDLVQGGSLRAGSAVFQQKENWATVAAGVELRSPNGWIRGRSGRAELQPGSYRPTRITVESEVTAESHASNGGSGWSLRSNWLQSDLSPQGNIQHVLARGEAQVERKASTGDETLKGDEIEAQMDAAGLVSMIEARQNPTFESSDRRLRAATRIMIDPKGTVTTEGASTLDSGESRIEGRDFSIQQDDRTREFSTPFRAKLTAGERTTEGDVTTAAFDAKTNRLYRLVQTGRVNFTEGAHTGSAEKVTITNEGQTVVLEANARVSDKKTGMTAPKITLNQSDKSVEGEGGVVMTDSSSGDQPIRVTANRMKVGEQTIEYWGAVHVLRGDGTIDADHFIAYTKENRFHADGHVWSRSAVLQARSEELDFTESEQAGQTARYRGNVWARKTDKKGKLDLETAAMDVVFKNGSVQVIEAKGAVKVTQGLHHGEGGEAVYQAGNGAVTLSGSATEDAVVKGPEGETRGSVIQTTGDGRVASVLPSRIDGRVHTSTNKLEK